MLALSDGMSLWIRRLSLTRSSELKGEEDKMEKSSGETGCPVSLWYDRMLVGEGLPRFLPVSAEMPKCSEINVRRSRLAWPPLVVLRQNSYAKHWFASWDQHILLADIVDLFFQTLTEQSRKCCKSLLSRFTSIQYLTIAWNSSDIAQKGLDYSVWTQKTDEYPRCEPVKIGQT